jgi:outer membrane immunogenic protein
MLRHILLASAVAVALAGAALAEPPPPPTPTFTSPAFNWSGVYGGLQIGGAWGYDDAFLFVPDYEILSEYDANMGGVKGGAHVGWNYQFPQFSILGDPFVVGLEGDVEGSSFGGTFQPFPDMDIFYTTRLPIQGSIRGRGGIACAGYPILYYLTGGVAFADIRNNYAVLGGDTITVSNTRVGWTAGAGIQYAITPNWSIRAEYRYTAFSFTDTSDQSIFRAHHDLEENMVQVGFSYMINTSK